MTAARPNQVHINRGVNRRLAIRRLALTMGDSQWKRGVVTFISDHYDPTPIFWMNR